MDKFLVFSDLHLHLWSYGSTQIDGWNSRLLSQEKVLDQIKLYATENDIKDILFCGDFFHATTVDAQVLTTACRALGNFHGINLYFLVGNHDQANKSGTIHSSEFLWNYGTVLDGPCHFALSSGVYCAALPYTEDESVLRNFLDTADARVLMLHQGVRDVPLNSTGFTLNEILKPEYIPDTSLAFAGHYHTHKQVTNNLWIPGSPMHLTWSDANEPRGFLEVGISEASYNIQLHLCDAPQYLDVTRDNFEATEMDGNYVRFRLGSSTSESEVSDLRDKARLAGARTVEFAFTDSGGESQTQQVVRNEPLLGMTAEVLANKFLDTRDDFSKRERDIFKELMEKKYEAPSFEST